MATTMKELLSSIKTKEVDEAAKGAAALEKDQSLKGERLKMTKVFFKNKVKPVMIKIQSEIKSERNASFKKEKADLGQLAYLIKIKQIPIVVTFAQSDENVICSLRSTDSKFSKIVKKQYSLKTKTPVILIEMDIISGIENILAS